MTGMVDVVGRYVAAFKALAGNGAGRVPAWLKEMREAAIARFAEQGFPTTRQEEWRFTSVATIAETPFTLAHPEAARAASPRDVDRLLPRGARRRRLVFVDGRWAPALSALDGLGAGVEAGGLAAACERDPEVVQRHLGRHAGLAGGAFAALNTAFLSDGAFVHVTAGTVMDEPLHLLFLSTLGRPGEPTVSHPRTLVVVDRGARAAVVETYGALGDGVYWTNAVTELVLDDGARAEHSRVQRESRQAYHVATTQSHQNRDSGLALHAIALGGALARHDVNAVLAGAGGHLILNGLYLLAGQQHADHHTVIDHAQHHCESHEYFNGVIDDRAHGVFNGRIIVRPGAQRTDSKQTNNNLLLSEEARADSQPQLEIYADDVKCTHGATLGPIDQTALFYLKSRGLGETEARALLTYGFGTEILGRMRAVEVRAQLDYLVRAWLARSAERRQAA